VDVEASLHARRWGTASQPKAPAAKYSTPPGSFVSLPQIWRLAALNMERIAQASK
jgi:hypothetical protein